MVNRQEDEQIYEKTNEFLREQQQVLLLQVRGGSSSQPPFNKVNAHKSKSKQNNNNGSKSKVSAETLERYFDYRRSFL